MLPLLVCAQPGSTQAPPEAWDKELLPELHDVSLGGLQFGKTIVVSTPAFSLIRLPYIVLSLFNDKRLDS